MSIPYPAQVSITVIGVEKSMEHNLHERNRILLSAT